MATQNGALVHVPAAAADLPDLAARANEEHRQCEQACKEGLQHALEAGRLLLEAKSKVEHGEWAKWLEEHCEFDERLAQKYMQVAKELPKLDEANTPRVADLSFRQALDLVSKNSRGLRQIPEEQREHALDLVEDDPQANMYRVKSQIMRDENHEELKRRALEPSKYLPTTRGKRTIRMFRNADEQMWCVQIGPDENGAKLPERVEREKKNRGYLAQEREIKKLRDRAKELREEAKELDRVAQDKYHELQEKLHQRVHEKYGPAYYYVESYDFTVHDEATERHLETLPTKELADYLFQNRGEKIEATRVSYRGDMAFMGLSSNGPGLEPFPVPWTGIGLEA
jgi:hypothetical protein